jgi:phosphate butyryltransferase
MANIQSFDELLTFAAKLWPKRIAVVNPRNEETFAALRDAMEQLHVHLFLAGDAEIIRTAMGSSPSITCAPAADPQTALALCIKAAGSGEADMLMKGSVDTGKLMKGVLEEKAGLRTGRLMSDVFVFEDARRHRLTMITDGGLNVAPTLKDKIDLILNAVQVAHALGNALPRVAILSATELVSKSVPSTMEAAEIAKMGARGEIPGCIVDGPFALDNAVDEEAAREKGITSPVAGQADILVMPTIEAANALAKSTTYFAGYRLGHVVVGARVPILIPSRADKSDAKLLSIAMGMMMDVGT